MLPKIEILPPQGKRSAGNPNWVPGESGNPAGGQDVKLRQRALRYARSKALSAMKRLAEMMDDPAAPYSVQAFCANAILDRALGKPKQEVAVESQSRSLEDILIAIASARRQAEEDANASSPPELSSDNSEETSQP